MDAIEVLKTRRSVRAYKREAVPRKTIEDIVDCGRLAATVINIQPWEFVVVTDPEALRSIANTTDFGGFIADAPACVVVICRETQYYLEDGRCQTSCIGRNTEPWVSDSPAAASNRHSARKPIGVGQRLKK